MSPTSRVRTTLLLLIGSVFVAMTGCSNPARDRMIGKWEANFEMTADEMEKLTPTDNPIVAGLGKLLMKKFRAEFQTEFVDDGTVVATATLLGATRTLRGTWQFVSGDESTTKIQITLDNDEAREMNFAFSGPDTFEAAPLGKGNLQVNRLVKFTRVVPAP